MNLNSYISNLTMSVKFEAPRNAQVNIAPHADYYISAFDAEQGTAIDFKEQSKDAAHIDFESHPGMYGATVIHQNNGDFTVTYVPSREDFLHLIEHIKRDESSLEQKVDKLARQLYVLQPVSCYRKETAR